MLLYEKELMRLQRHTLEVQLFDTYEEGDEEGGFHEINKEYNGAKGENVREIGKI